MEDDPIIQITHALGFKFTGICHFIGHGLKCSTILATSNDINIVVPDDKSFEVIFNSFKATMNDSYNNIISGIKTLYEGLANSNIDYSNPLTYASIIKSIGFSGWQTYKSYKLWNELIDKYTNHKIETYSYYINDILNEYNNQVESESVKKKKRLEELEEKGKEEYLKLHNEIKKLRDDNAEIKNKIDALIKISTSKYTYNSNFLADEN
jgi:L-rhamnose mutarotase